MSEEIRIPLLAYPHPVSNPRCIWDVADELPNSLFIPEGWHFKDGEQAELLARLPEIPVINGTPNSKIRGRWFTPSASTNAFKLYMGASVVIPDTDSINPSSFALETSITDTSAAAGRHHQFDISLSSLSGQQQGRSIIFRFRRDRQTPDAADLLAASVYITDLIYIADA